MAKQEDEQGQTNMVLLEMAKILERNTAVLAKIESQLGTDDDVVKQKTIDVIQINVGKKRYFCKTQEEQAIFAWNNPGAVTETFKLELPDFIANDYLNDPENKKAFEKKEQKDA